MLKVQELRDKRAEERQKQRKGAKPSPIPNDPNRPSKGALKNKHSIDAELERLEIATSEAIWGTTNQQVLNLTFFIRII